MNPEDLRNLTDADLHALLRAVWTEIYKRRPVTSNREIAESLGIDRNAVLRQIERGKRDGWLPE